MRFEGSSPRVRGKRTSRVAATVLPRLIPARAGKTPWRAPTRAAAWAHPRACGENANMLIRECWARGSSPRVRGKPGAGRVGQGLGRLIPARAGKTGKSMLLAVPVGAHPRACGENGRPGSRRRRAVGSSPRVRGKRMVWPSKTATPRLIPARAGKTPCSVTSTWVPGAHPRACGENPRIPCPVRAQDGSSPRVRGKRIGGPHAQALARLIPARAGKTCPSALRIVGPRAHPRACGENEPVRALVLDCDGSSPRVRGKPEQARHPVVDGRLIPARAGKTTRRMMVDGLCRAHPRACGENSS